MSYLVEQPPYCDLLRLSLSTRRFVRFGRTPLRLVSMGPLSVEVLVTLSAPPAFFTKAGGAFFFALFLREVFENFFTSPTRWFSSFVRGAGDARRFDSALGRMIGGRRLPAPVEVACWCQGESASVSPRGLCPVVRGCGES